MDDIKNLGHNVYIAAGRVILMRDDDFDPNDPVSREFLLRSGREVFMQSWDKPRYGDLTVVVFGPLRNGPFGGQGRVMDEMRMSSLPDDVREQLRKEFPDHASEI